MGGCDMKDHAITISFLSLVVILTLGMLIALPEQALAQGTEEVAKVESFLRNIITAVAGLAGLIATGFFVLAGFKYMTSSGQPDKLEKSKRTLLYSGVGLAVTIGAVMLTNLVTSISTSAFV